MHTLNLGFWLALLLPVFTSAVAWRIAIWALRQPDADSEVVRRLIRGFDPAGEDAAASPVGRDGRTAKSD